MNYFELFEIPVSLRVDKDLLAKKYVALQKKYHPDFYTQESEYEKEEALEKSSQINKALKTLRNPDETIKYVLQLKGLLQEEEKYQLPPDFLMEVMELNEDLDSSSRAQVEDLEAEIFLPVKPIIEDFSDATTTEALLKVKEYYYKKKYLQRILDRMAD